MERSRGRRQLSQAAQRRGPRGWPGLTVAQDREEVRSGHDPRRRGLEAKDAMSTPWTDALPCAAADRRVGAHAGRPDWRTLVRHVQRARSPAHTRGWTVQKSPRSPSSRCLSRPSVSPITSACAVRSPLASCCIACGPVDRQQRRRRCLVRVLVKHETCRKIERWPLHRAFEA